MKDKTERM